MLICFAAVMSAAAACLTETEVTGLFQTGGVNISMEILEKGTGGEKIFRPPEAAVPGQKVSMIPRITNHAETCYIRITPDIKMLNQTNRPVIPDDGTGWGKEWIHRGSVYYYTRVLQAGESVDLYKGIIIPREWTGQQAADFQVTFFAEAIQAQNFEPDFTSKQPWGNVETQISQVGDHYLAGISKKVEDKDISLIYNKDAALLAVNKDTFLKGKGIFMPGQQKCEKLILKNSGNKTTQLFFKSQCLETELLDKVRLTIQCGDTVLYKGKLSCREIRTFQKLAELDPGQKETVLFFIHVPEELQNIYQENCEPVSWWFTAKESGADPIQTGDDTGILWAILLITAAAVAASACYMRRGEKYGGTHI